MVEQRGFSFSPPKALLDRLQRDSFNAGDFLSLCQNFYNCLEQKRCPRAARDHIKAFRTCHMYVATRHHVVTENPLGRPRTGRIERFPGISHKMIRKVVADGWTSYTMGTIIRSLSSGNHRRCNAARHQDCKRWNGCHNDEHRPRGLKKCRKVRITSLYVLRRIKTHPWAVKREAYLLKQKKLLGLVNSKGEPYDVT